MSKVYIGVDPGEHGGLVALDGQVVAFHSMPPTRRGVYDWLARFLPAAIDDPEPIAVVEKVSGYIGTPHPGSSMFSFGANAERVLMALTILGITFEEVAPQTWQGAYGLKRVKGDTDSTFKNRMKCKAQQLFPRLVVTLATADALLISHYCRRKHGDK